MVAFQRLWRSSGRVRAADRLIDERHGVELMFDGADVVVVVSIGDEIHPAVIEKRRRT